MLKKAADKIWQEEYCGKNYRSDKKTAVKNAKGKLKQTIFSQFAKCSTYSFKFFSQKAIIYFLYYKNVLINISINVTIKVL